MTGDKLGFYLALVLYALPGLVIGFTLHELAHAFVALRFGDNTPRRQGRITVNPIDHLDPIGFTALLVLGFGWAKPVQFNPYVVRSPARQAILAAAGPFTNLLVAVAFAVALHVQLAVDPAAPLEAYLSPTFLHGGGAAILYWFLVQGFLVNVLLLVFNMLPIPGIDGFTVVRGLLGRWLGDLFDWMERNRQLVWLGAIVLLFLLPQISGGTANPLSVAVRDFSDFLYRTFVTTDFFPVGGLPSLFSALS